VSAFKLLNSIWIFASSAQHELASSGLLCLWYSCDKFTRHKFRIPRWPLKFNRNFSSRKT